MAGIPARNHDAGPRGIARAASERPQCARSCFVHCGPCSDGILHTNLLDAGDFVHYGPRFGGALYTRTGRQCTYPLRNDLSSALSPHRLLQVPHSAMCPADFEVVGGSGRWYTSLRTRHVGRKSPKKRGGTPKRACLRAISVCCALTDVEELESAHLIGVGFARGERGGHGEIRDLLRPPAR